MGAVYDITLKIKFNNEQDVIDATRSFVDANSDYARFSDVDYSSIISAIQIILPKRGFYLREQTDNYIDCNCGFDASYGWESVMQDWFNYLVETSAVLDHSTIAIYPDSGWEKGVAESGTVHWVSDEGFKWGAGANPYEVEIPERPAYPVDERPEPVPMTVDDPELQRAIDCINEYCEDEFGHIGVEVDDDLSDLGLLYTFAGENDEWDCQVSADLINNKILYYINGDLKGEDTYSSLSDMIDNALVDLNWDDLYSNCCDYIDWDEESDITWGDDEE